MIKQTITRRLEFCAGHRVLGHEGKCRNLHGHQYIALITAQSDTLDNLGRIIDFGVLKQKIGKWIDDNLDHGMIIFSQDGEALKALYGLEDQKVYVLETNPTAENISAHLLKDICPTLLAGTGVSVVRITLYETPNCSADSEFVENPLSFSEVLTSEA